MRRTDGLLTAEENYGVASLPSETIEPLLAGTLGVLFSRYNSSKKTEMDARRFYYGACALSSLTVRNAAPHATLAMSNHLQMVADLIERDIGIDPIREKW